MALPAGPSSALPQLFVSDVYPWMLDFASKWRDPVTLPILGQGPVVLVWRPELVRAVMTADPSNFDPGTAEALGVIVGAGSLFMKSGAEHARTRKLLAPPFHGDRMRTYGALIRDTTRRWAAKIERGATRPILPIAQGITLDIIVEAIFGERDAARVERLHAQTLAIVAAFSPLAATFRALQRDFGGFGPWARFKRSAGALEASMRELIAEKRTRPGDDVLSLLIAARHEDGAALSEREVLDQLLTFVVAGHETTATSLAWAMYELHRHPEWRDRLVASLGAVDDPAELVKNAELGAVVSEVLRQHPPVPMVTRKVNVDFPLGDHVLPAGTRIGVVLYVAHNLDAAFPAPGEFRPERFLGSDVDPFEYLPFGGGARRCLGAAFATYELKIALATLLRAGRFTLEEPRPLRHTFRVGTYGPEHGVRMSLA